ncbi:hypothetical protein GEV33_007544 [Tenebrio molitor]|uniref:Sodium channel protein Nach n=1 Tax=Tenebrio molitor TaxID=7067 RepID=A0A8J6HJ12_TENMO|nr:hypothetical protein GEV33_007544 [Tenebrio molitor]
MINTSDSVRAYSKQRRRCYFQSERHLQYFKIYSSVNCDMECLANYTLDVCDCVNFYMPRDNTSNICGTAMVDCMRDAEQDMYLKNLKRKLEKYKNLKRPKSQTHCDCLPLCTDLSYDVETSQTDWEWNKCLAEKALESLSSLFSHGTNERCIPIITFDWLTSRIFQQKHYAAADDRRDIGNKTVAKMDPACEKELYHNVEKYVREYNEVTGIHGLRYLTEKRSKTEKIFWVIILLLSLAGCIYMIYEVLYKYNNSPVVLKPIGEDILPICVYMNRVLPCKELLTPIFVDQGICYSFNILGRDEIFRKHVYHYADYYDIRNKSRQDFDIETGYEEGAGINTYPRRALTSGADNALSIFFEYDTEETDFVCNNFHQGFRVLIHNPWEVPRLSKHYFSIPFDKVVIAAMYPEMVRTSQEVRRFKPETRKCYMADERPLKHFQKYTQSNCLLECLTNYTLNECGCVWFSMPRESDTAICGVGSAECMDETEVKIKVKELEYKIMGKSFCDCKPSCTQLKFNVETSDSDFYFKEYFKTVHQEYFKNNTSHWSVLDIYFKEEQFMTKERHQLYGTSDLISNLGGLLDDRRDIGNKPVARMDPACEKGLYHNMKKYVREYNEVTGIHGLRYLTEKRSKTEKIFWVIILLVSLAGCIYMIYEVLYKYNNSPVVVSFATEDTPLHEIPFPAITICPEFKYTRQKFNFSELKPDGEDILPLCIYMDRVVPCKELFTPIFVDQGICYSFNILGRDEIFRKHVYHYADYYDIRNDSRQDFDIETGYEEGAGINTYPRRALTSGADNALSIFFEYNTDETDFVCNNFLQGFRVLIHNPWEVPRLSKHYFRIPFDKVVIAAMSPEMVTTSREVRRFKPETRKCYMADERPLKHFQKYTQSNCLLECLTNYTLNECGCVWFFMPNIDTAVCGVGSAECMDKTEVKIKVKKLEYKIMGKSFCDCKPSCTQLKFNVETSDGDFYFKEYFKTVHQKYFKNNTTYQLPSAPILTVPIQNLLVSVAEKALENPSSSLSFGENETCIPYPITFDWLTPVF